MLFNYAVYISINRPLVEHRTDELVSLPFYGGAKGQVLQISRKPDGSIASEIVKQNAATIETNNDDISFEGNLANIQKAAAELVSLQQSIKLTGKISTADQKMYADNLEKLGISAQNLAHIQQAGTSDDLRLLFESSEGNRLQKPMILDPNNFPSIPIKNDEDDEDVGEEQETTEESVKPTDDNESVGINIPDKDSSIAEAKPVGLAIAGVGGLASSKPSATAIVGPGGLAVAKPVATAIAGIAPSEISGLGIPLGHKLKNSIKNNINRPFSKKYGLASVTTNDGRAVLVGPNYYEESRISEKDINAVDDNSSVIVDSNTNSTKMTEEAVDNSNNNSNKMALPADDETSSQLHQHQQQYPFIPPVVPLRFKWDTEPIIEMPGYEPIPFLDNRAFANQPFFPYQHIPPISPFQFYNP